MRTSRDLIFLIEDVHVRFAIRDDEKRFVLKLIADIDSQAFSRPQRFMRIAQTRFFLCGGPGSREVAGEMRDLPMDLIKDFALGKNRGSF